MMMSVDIGQGRENFRARPTRSLHGLVMSPPVSRKTQSKTPADKETPRKRLSTQERERQIIDGAVAFFSEFGLNGQMRELATRIGITHPLLFHYFPNKSALIQRVYEEVYLGRWKQEWELWIKDRSQPIEARLIRVYTDYAKTVLTKEWVRILIYSALSDRYIPDHYFRLLRQRMLRPILRETRVSFGLAANASPSEAENELLWGLHGGVFYIGVRRWIYGHAFPKNLEKVIGDRVRAYLLAADEVCGREGKAKRQPVRLREAHNGLEHILTKR